jgi:PEGA domain
MNKTGLVIVFLLFPFLVSGESSISLQFDRENWNIALEGFSGTLPPAYGYLKSSIPDLIKQELHSSQVHILSQKEISHYRQVIIDDAEKKIIQELSQNYTSRDKLIFDKSSSDSALDNLNEKISDLKDERLELAFADESLIKTADLLNVQWIGVDDDEEFLTAEQYLPSVTAEIYDLDFLISGTIREIEGYFLLEVYGYDRSADEKITIYSRAGSIDEIEEIAVEASNELRSIILGRPWSILIVETDNSDALIYGDGELIGVGSAELKTAQPGKIFLEAIGEDNSYWSREAELTALEINDYSGILSASDIDFISFDSQPTQADVYIGARWAGKTPLKLPRYRERNIWITVKSDGYYDRSFEVSGDSPESIIIEMTEEDMTELEIFDLRKKEFYRSLGRFGISVAGPVITGGIFSNYASRQNGYAYEYLNTSDTAYYDLAAEMERNYYISYGVFWGTIGISGGLLVDVFVKLSRYIKAAEALAE